MMPYFFFHLLPQFKWREKDIEYKNKLFMQLQDTAPVHVLKKSNKINK